MDCLSWHALPAAGTGCAVRPLLSAKKKAGTQRQTQLRQKTVLPPLFLSQLRLCPRDKASGENEPEFLGEESFRSRLIFKVKFLPFIIY